MEEQLLVQLQEHVQELHAVHAHLAIATFPMSFSFPSTEARASFPGISTFANITTPFTGLHSIRRYHPVSDSISLPHSTLSAPPFPVLLANIDLTCEPNWRAICVHDN